MMLLISHSILYAGTASQESFEPLWPVSRLAHEARRSLKRCQGRFSLLVAPGETVDKRAGQHKPARA